jgi:threonine aldolase
MKKEKIFFVNDYATVAHPNLLKALSEANFNNEMGYGDDDYCQEAINLIKKECGNDDVDVFFLMGGTQTNMIVLNSILRSYQGVISAQTGHIATHETGAIERGGHKVLTIEANEEGKLNAKQIEDCCNDYNNDVNSLHIVQPGCVYISHPTESGALYTKDELIEINEVCKKEGLLLYVDGARLGYALASIKNNITLKDLTFLTDVFYIGGTKCGAMLGEALVINNKELTPYIRYSMKPCGGLLAKGMILGIQFKELFTNNLYVEICKKADDMAQRIANTFEECGYTMFTKSYTNQQFVIIDNESLKKFDELYDFAMWMRIDDEHSIVRVCTSWSTSEQMISSLINDIKRFRLN